MSANTGSITAPNRPGSGVGVGAWIVAIAVAVALTAVLVLARTTAPTAPRTAKQPVAGTVSQGYNPVAEQAQQRAVEAGLSQAAIARVGSPDVRAGSVPSHQRSHAALNQAGRKAAAQQGANAARPPYLDGFICHHTGYCP